MTSEQPDAAELSILFEDDDLIAVAKPSGLFVHRSDVDRSVDAALLQLVRDHSGSFVYPVHRLDRATSGVVVFAKSAAVAAAMGQLFSGRAVAKTYHALVRGHCPLNGEVNDPLIPARGRGKPSDHPHAVAQEAVTQFTTLDRFEIPQPSGRYATTRCSLVEVRPLTGRFHQIRRHFNYISHPVIGDTSHGDGRQNQFFRQQFEVTRLMLAAVKLQFAHPVNRQETVITAAPEESFQAVIQRLSAYRV